MTPEIVTLSPESIDALAARIIAGVTAQMLRQQSPVLTEEEAMTLAGYNNGEVKAFREWCRTYSVPTCAKHRYSRESVMRGLRKQAKQVHGNKR
ncbi:MAG: hypothetical protein SFY80_00845 [Verrucomicrobiota bacterium]|nr:hypothetical protein [Verrucomicrobiota bacterium]